MEHERVAEDGFRCWRTALYEEVVVGIHARNHVPSRLSSVYKAHYRGLLAAFQMVGPCGEHYFKVARLVLEASEDGAPEEDVVVAFHIRHNLPPCLPRVQSVGRLYVFRRYVVGESSAHVVQLLSVMSVTSVTWSAHPFIITAGLCVVRIICTLGLSSRMRSMSRSCQSMCRLTSGSSMKRT